jgi:hypothetical protein
VNDLFLFFTYIGKELTLAQQAFSASNNIYAAKRQ